MQVLVVASQKGGAGKTTLSGHLAVEVERINAGPVALLDTDPQRGLAAWWDERKASTPVIIRPPDLKDLGPFIEVVRGEGFKLLIIDTPPAVTDLIGRVMSHADLILVPVKPSPHDLRAVGPTIDLADRAGRRVVFIISQATARARLTGEAAVALSQHGTVSPITIHHRVEYAASMTDGRTVQETDPNGKSACEIASLWQYVSQQLNRSRNNHHG